MVELDGLPGEELIRKGLDDLDRGTVDTQEALLVTMARTKLKGLGLPVSPHAFEVDDAELKLYALLGQTHEDAYGEYNALRRRLGRFERALEARVFRDENETS